MKRALAVLVRSLVLLAGVGAISSAQAAWNQKRATAADATLAPIVTSATPSGSACVAIDGVVVYAKGFGEIAPGVAPTSQTIYRIGSLSKQFTAAAILALIEDGAVVPSDGSKFGLQSNVSLFFSGVDPWSTGPGATPMTVQRLLTMRSNLPTYTTNPPMPGFDWTQPVNASVLLKAILAFKPANPSPNFAYSNTNYFLLAAIIDKLTGQKLNPNAGNQRAGSAQLFLATDYRAYLRKRIFARAGLTATNFIDDPNPLGTMAPPTVAPPPTYSTPSWPKGAGAIQSNVLDLCAWDAALMKNQVINAQSVATMGTAGTPLGGKPPTAYAMGWFVAKYPNYLEYYHNGNIAGYTAENLIDLFGGTHFVSVSILTNGDYTPGLDVAARALATSAMKPDILVLPPGPNRY